METEVNGIRPPKESQETKCRGKGKYTKILEYFENLSASIGKYNGLLTGGGNGKHYHIQTEKFNEIFYNNSFNFLDVLYLFISCASSQCIGVLNFLLSDETKYTGQRIQSKSINFDNLNKDLKEYEEDTIKKTIKKRRLFTLAVLSLIQDYFNTYEINTRKQIQENKELKDNEKRLKIMFESIFNNKKDLLNIFQKIKIVRTNTKTIEKIKINFHKYLENIFNNKVENINNQINEVKQQILNYFNFCYNSKEQNKNWVKDFLNTCGTEIVGQQFKNEQQMNSFLQQGLERERLEKLERERLERERLERERLSCFKPTRMKYEIIDNFGKQVQNSVNFESRQSINYQINFNTTYNIRCNQYNQNTFMTTFQQNQKISQNLNEVLEMFGNGFGQGF